jgi:hypothetical protein
MLGGLILSNGVANRNLYSMLDIFIGYEAPKEVSLDEEKPFLRDEESTKIEKNDDPLQIRSFLIILNDPLMSFYVGTSSRLS